MNRKKLSEVCTVIVPMRDKPKEFVGKGEGIPWCRIEDIEGKFLHCSKSSRYVTNECIEDMNLKVFPAGTVLCAVTGASIGKYAVTTSELITNQTFAGLVCGDEIYNEYLYYYIKLQTKALVNHSVGCAQEYITRETLENLTIPVYPYEEQIRLVSILKNIDDKISNNNSINAELESLAKTIYDYWFLQFEFPNEEGLPYKSSGGKMVWSEELKREIPEGWEVKKLKDIITTVDNRGKNPPYSEHITSHPIIDVATLRDYGRVIDYGNCTKYVTDDTYNTWFRSGHPLKGDIIFSTVGSLAETKIYYPNKRWAGSIAQNVIGFRMDENLYSYVYQALVLDKEKIIRYKIGSVQPSLKVGHVLEHTILIPNENLLCKYAKIIEDINLKLISVVDENQELAALRDWLLPMLMNGQVGFKDTE